MKKLTKLLFAFACVLFLQNCTDDDFDSRTVPNQQTEADILKDEEFRADNFGSPTTGNFIGLIKDIDDNRILGAQITIGNSVTTTDRNGMFILNNADVFENFAYIKVQKEGYINGSRVVIPKTTGENRIDIVLLKKDITASVTSGEFSEVSLPNGAKVNFSGGFVRQDGSEYNGQVDVVLNYIEPNSINTFTQMPGSLLAQTEANDARNLETYGMLSVNLFSPSGEQLNINEFNRATIEFPVHYSQSGTAPDFIPLWYFDEAQGYWKEEGQAVKFGNMYVAEVSHFTWWNCDVPLDAIDFCFNLTPANNTSTTPYYVIIKRLTNDQYIYSGVVYSGSFECGLIPRNEEVSVSIYQFASLCFGQLIETQTLGGYSMDTSTVISFDESVNLLTTNITGIANDCDGNPITNGYLYVDEYNSYSITNGMINIGLQHCGIQTTTIQLFDFDTNQWAIIDNVPLNTQNFNLGVVSTCANNGGIFNGNLRLSTQQEVNDFGVSGFTSVNGNVTIGDESTYTDITNLGPLASITNISDDLKIIGNENLQSLQDMSNIATVGGSLFIENNPSLTSLSGFTSLTSVEFLYINDNDALTSLAGCDNFTSIQNLQVSGNDGLTSLSGFNNSISIGLRFAILGNNSLTSLQGLDIFGLTSQNDLTVSSNNALTSLQGIESISSLRFLTIHNNNALNSLTSLENLTTVLDLDINDNDALLNLEGLGQLQARSLLVSNNDALLSLNGIENLTIIVNFSIINIGVRQWEGDCTGYVDGPNPSLTDLCALQNVLINSNWNSNNDYCVVVVNNAYNPSGQDILNGNCSQ